MNKRTGDPFLSVNAWSSSGTRWSDASQPFSRRHRSIIFCCRRSSRLAIRRSSLHPRKSSREHCTVYTKERERLEKSVWNRNFRFFKQTTFCTRAFAADKFWCSCYYFLLENCESCAFLQTPCEEKTFYIQKQ